MKPDVLFIVGPTASGKSTLAVELALRLGGEIVSADSMQVYKGMDIGTAKLSPDKQKNVPHHLLSILSPGRTFSAYDFRKLALKAIKEITARGHLPIVVGGTGFYIRVLLRGISSQPGGDPRIRKQLEKQVEEKGLEFVYRRLQDLDPQRAKEIHPKDKKRIIRALEVLKLSGRKASVWHSHKQKSLEELGYRPLLIGLSKDRQELYSQIEKRVDEMFEKGFVEEVKRLSGKRLSKTAAQAVGYKELRMALKGEISLEQAKERIKLNTRRLAKRQTTWFRREKGIEWFTWRAGEEQIASMVQLILARLRQLPL